MTPTVSAEPEQAQDSGALTLRDQSLTVAAPSKPNGHIGNLPSADTVKTALEQVDTRPEHIDSILWLLSLGRIRKLSQSRLATLIGFDGSVLSRVFRGKYPADIDPVIEAIDTHRRLLAQEVVSKDRPVVDTWLLSETGTFCDVTRGMETIGLIWGRSHIGKSTALTEYARRNNHGQTIYVKMPPGGAPRMFLLSLARACAISERNAYDQLRDRLIGFFRPGMLLVVDEMHQTIIGRKLQTITLEVIRDLHDTAGCGIVLCGTKVFKEAFEDGKKKTFFEQLDNRITIERKFDGVTKADIALVLNAYGLTDQSRSPEGAAVVQGIVKSHGLGKLCKFLLFARRPALKHKEVFGWEHIIRASATLEGWKRGDSPETVTTKGGR